MIETGEIKMEPKKMFSVLFMQNGFLWLMIAIFGIIVFIALGITIDPRFFILALIWLFMITPLGVAFLYFFYGMKPLTAFNSIPHKLIFSDSSIKVRLLEYDKEGNEKENPEKKDYEVAKNSFTGMKTGGDYILLFFNKEGWLYLPVASFASLNEFKEIVESYG